VEDNLVLRAARHFAQIYSGATLGSFHLVQAFCRWRAGPSVADRRTRRAARACLARVNAVSLGDVGVIDAARATGADCPGLSHEPRADDAGPGDELGLCSRCRRSSACSSIRAIQSQRKKFFH